MKKLFIFLALMFAFTAISNAQMLVTKLPHGTSYVNVATDYTLTSTTARYWEVDCEPDWYNAQNWTIHLDSLSGAHKVGIVMSGRLDANASWATIGSTVTWGGTTADTTILLTNATEVAYRQFKITFTGIGAYTTTIANMSFKFFNGTP